LCGVGEDGNWQQEGLRASIEQDLSVIEDQIEAEEDSPSSHFKSWSG